MEPEVIIETSKGTMKAVLYTEKAPKTTKNFINLVNQGFYDGKIFHRVIKKFMIQGGCPKGDGTGGTSKTIKLEVRNGLKHEDGSLSMARSMDPNSASCQFFICDGPQPGLNDNYAVFGKVVEGIEVLRTIASVKTTKSDRPKEEVRMISIKMA